MEFALERALSESRYVNVAPRGRINDTLALIRQSSTAVLTEDLARQVAIRDRGIKAVVTGRVEKFGQKYVFTVRVLEPVGGEAVAVFERTAAQSQLPDAARSVSTDLRLKLGEKATSVGAGAPEVEKATTASLAAFRAFSAGMTFLNQGGWAAAVPLLEEAILIDPQFASAHIYAAHSYLNLNQSEKAAPHFEAAFQLAPGVSQRERLFILGSYYQRFREDRRRAADHYEALVSLYPDDYWGVYNLSHLYTGLNMPREGAEALERSLALRPNNNHYGAWAFLWMWYRFDHPDETKSRHYGEALRRLRATPPGRSWFALGPMLDLEVATDRWVRGDIKAAAQEVARISTSAHNNTESAYWTRVAAANLTLGKLSTAKDLCSSLVETIPLKECLLQVAWVSGNRDLGKEQLSTLRGTGPSIHAAASMNLMLFGMFGETTIPKSYEKIVIDPNVHGWLLLAGGRFAEAAKLFEAQPVTRVFFPHNRFPMAIALERLGRLEQAIARLEEEDLPHNTLSSNWSWPQYRFKLAELYRKVGRIDDAIKVENQLRHYLSEADADFPILAQLRAAEAATPKIARSK